MSSLKTFLDKFIEIINTALSSPEELSLAVHKDNRPDSAILVLLALIGFGNTVAIYQLRNNYDAGFFLFLPIAFVLSFLFFAIVSVFIGALIDAFIKFTHPGKDVSSWQTIRLTAIGFLPFVFFLPVSVPASFFSFGFLFLIFFLFLLMLWSLYIMITSIRYLYELEKREITIVILFTMALVYGFPFLFMIWGTMEVAVLAAGN